MTPARMANPTVMLLGRLAGLALWLFLFSIPSEKSVEIPGLGTVSRLLGGAAMGIGLIAIAARGAFRIPGPFHLAMSLFVIWSAMTYQWSMMPEWTGERLITYAQLLAMALLIWEFCPREADVTRLMSAYVCGTLVPALDTAQRFLRGQQTYYQRFATSGFDPNDLALTLSLSLPISYYLSLRRDGWTRWLFIVQMIITAVIVLLTASRGGLLTMLVGLSLVLTARSEVFPSSRNNQLIGAVLVAAGLCAVVWIVPVATWKRLATLSSEVSQGTLNSRTVLWNGGWQAFGNVPVHGVGAGAYPESLSPILGRPRNFTPVAHNSFLSVLVETGLIGFVLFALTLATLIAAVAGTGRLERRFWFTVLATWGLGVSALTWEHRKPTWVVFGLLAAHTAAIGVSRPPSGRRPFIAYQQQAAFAAARAT